MDTSTLFMCGGHNVMVATTAHPHMRENMMHIAVFGANGPTGQNVTKQALAERHTVTAVTRHPETFPLRHERLQVRRADVFDLAAVRPAVAGQEAVPSPSPCPFR